MTPPPLPVTLDDLIFPADQHASLSTQLHALHASSNSAANRLRSIHLDALFVAAVADAYARPVFANERAGTWYVPPARTAGSCYFKSTDGHAGEWSFSLRRLNLHVLDAVGRNDGVIIVDTTRRGKRMPDALSKTIPIWLTVLNRVLFPTQKAFHSLPTPPTTVSHSEAAQISAQLNAFTIHFTNLSLDLATIRAVLTKPLKPLWVTPSTPLPLSPPFFADFHPLILVTASRTTPHAEIDYVQGAADDSEAWAHGLTPSLFWAHAPLLLGTPPTDLPSLIPTLTYPSPTLSPSSSSAPHQPTRIPPTNLHIALSPSSSPPTNPPSKPLLITISTDSTRSTTLDLALDLQTPSKKPIPLHRSLPPLLEKAVSFLLTSHPSSTWSTPSSSPYILISSPPPPSSETSSPSPKPANDTDITLAIALTLLTLFYADDGQYLPVPVSIPVPIHSPAAVHPPLSSRSPTPANDNNGNDKQSPTINKSLTKRRLAWLAAAAPLETGAMRGRVLGVVNNFVMGGGRGRDYS
ncbi:MAG: hypothetical protein M1833_000082 [Piccolia ochrophora]|nr:MAG: hypothetical protein M1833_000082 [Piccolia ochrophora]